MTLSTQADLENFLQLEFDMNPEPVVDYLIEGADSLIRDYLGYNPEAEDGITEVHDPTLTPNLFVRRPPIRALTSITIDGDAVDADSYFFYQADEPKSGLIRRGSGTWNGPFRGIVVTYDGGWNAIGSAVAPELPFTLRDASVRVVARSFHKGAAFAAKSGKEGIRTIALAGSDSITWADEADKVAEGALELVQSDRSVLARYKRGWFV